MMKLLLVCIGLPAGLWAAGVRVGTGNSAPPPPAKLASAQRAPYQVGKAARYGDSFHGRSTASGEVYDKQALTAAHRQLPLGTLVLVTHLQTGRSVVVRVNDRGPWGDRDRVIDLSHAASRKLGIRHVGLARVRLDRLRPSD